MEKKYCGSCSMPMVETKDFGGENIDNNYCVHCCDEKGNLKPYEEVLNGMADFAVKNMGVSRKKALDAARRNMAMMPAWRID